MKNFMQDCFKKREPDPSSEMDLLLDDFWELPDNEEDPTLVTVGSSIITIEPETLEAWEVDRETLQSLIRAEDHLDFSKWIYLEHLLEKIAIFSLLKKRDISGALSEREHIWLHGRGIPLQNYKAMAKARAITGFRQGVEFGILRPVQLILYALLIYQLHAAISAPEKTVLLPELWDIAWNGKPQSIRAALSLIVANPQNAPYLWPLLSFPLVWGGIKAYLYGRRTLFRSPHNFQKAINALYAHPEPLIMNIKGHRFELISKNRRFWWNFLRWFFPLHYADRQINHLIEALLFNGKLTEDQRQEAFQAIQTFIKRNGGYSRIVGLHAEQLFAAGIALKQFNLLDLEDEEEAQTEFYQTRLKEKTQALQLIRSYNPGMMTAWKNDRLWGLVHNSYANYLRWTLGDWESKPIYAGYLIIKTAKIVFIIKLGLNVYNAIIDYLRCPLPYEAQDSFSKIILKKQRTDYTQACFDSLLKAFNKVPGQPACTLVNFLPQVDLNPRITFLNFSNHGLTGQQVADILIGLKHYHPKINITEIDLSGNQINKKEDFDVLIPLLKSIQVLRLAKNNLNGGKTDPDITAGIVALGEGLHHLTALTTLDLSNNMIGFVSAAGTQAIGNSLPYLTNLRILDFSGNMLGYVSDTGLKIIGNNLRYLTQLHTLDLSRNSISFRGPDDIEAIGVNLRYLTQLRILNLSANYIGWVNTTAIDAIAESLHSLSELSSLDLSHNWITLANNDPAALITSITQLTQLEKLYIQQLQPFSGIALQTLQLYWQHRNKQTDLYMLRSVDAIQTFFKQFQPGIHSMQVSDYFLNPDVTLMTAFVEGLMPFKQTLESLYFSNNFLGYSDTKSTEVLGNALRYFTQLDTLDLSGNYIGNEGTMGTQAIAKSLSYLTALHTLNLSGNVIGLYSVAGVKLLADSFHNLTALHTLNLSGNNIGWRSTSTQIITDGLRYLTALRILDLSRNQIGGFSTTDTEYIGENLRYLTELITLDLSGNLIELSGTNGSVILTKNLHFLSHLQHLYLQSNFIGKTGPEGVIALTTAMPDLVCHGLEDFNLGIDIRNMTWQTDQQLRDAGFIFYSKIQSACTANTCHGTTVGLPTGITCETRRHIPSDEVCYVFAGTSAASSLQPPLPYHLLIAVFAATRAAIASANALSKDNSNSFILMILGATLLLLTTLLWRSKMTPCITSFFHPKEFNEKQAATTLCDTHSLGSKRS